MYSTPTACTQTVILHRSLFTSYFGITGKCTRNKIILKETNFSMTAYMGLLKKCSWLSSHRGNGWQIYIVCTCMHVRGAHRLYMHACQRCTLYVHACMSEVHTVCTYACQRCTQYVHACIYPLETMIALTPYTFLPCCFPLSQFPVSIKGDPKCWCRNADNMPTL